MVKYLDLTEDYDCLDYASQALKNIKRLCFASQDIRSLTGKCLLLGKSNIDLLALDETLLSEDIEDAEIAHQGYNLFCAEITPPISHLVVG